MKKTLLIGLTIGLFMLPAILISLQTQIDTATAEIQSLTAEIQSLTSAVNFQKIEITQTKLVLDSTKTKLQDSESELVVVTSERDEVTGAKEDLEKELGDTASQLSFVEGSLRREKARTSELQTDVQAIQSEIEEIREELQLYHDTGITVDQETRPRYRTSLDGSFNLQNNPDAVNVSWSQVKAFLKDDRTDNIPYMLDSFRCGEFAEMLHNNAEENGIKAAFVGIKFKDGSLAHALNAFVTTDRGLVYIDTTGFVGGGGPYHSDRTANVRVGQRIYEYFIFTDDWEMYNDGPKVAQVEFYW
jgi:hypothetical protein